MKNLSKLILLLVCSFVTVCASAQNVIYDNGKTRVYDNGFVYCEDGFVKVRTEFPKGYSAKYCWGIYTADMKVLVQAEPYVYFFVAKGTEVIAANAIRDVFNLYIPTSIKYIAPNAFSGMETHSGMEIADIIIYSSDLPSVIAEPAELKLKNK